MIVYVVTDEKYGPQAVFLSEEAADRAVEQDESLAPSGLCPAILEFEVEEQIDGSRIIYSSNNEKRYVIQVNHKVYMVIGFNSWNKRSDEMYLFEGGPQYNVGDDFYGQTISKLEKCPYGVVITVE